VVYSAAAEVRVIQQALQILRDLQGFLWDADQTAARRLHLTVDSVDITH
jgi:hypothetical protein